MRRLSTEKALGFREADKNEKKILYVIYSAIKARYYSPTIPELREKLERSEDSARTAQDLNELIEQHGPQGWVDALIANVGPGTQLLLEDSADILERLTKYVYAS